MMTKRLLRDLLRQNPLSLAIFRKCLVNGWNVILALKIAVILATGVFTASLVAIARGERRLHGRLNIVFAALIFGALASLELSVRLFDPHLLDYFDDATRRALCVHLCFAVPAASLMPLMLWTGLSRKRRAHLTLAWLFGACWLGTILTGLFLLPHAPPQ